ncbi:MAG TPA: ATP-dependent Clp protease proteolytic subunit [bacterium]|nr:ATP-dependent Clp protease proteolytic subunit [bacterium]
MSFMKEYIDKRLSVKDLENELAVLMRKYNKLRNTYLFVYSTAIRKNIPQVALEQDDFYIIYDILSKLPNTKKIDFYIETPGGSGEAAEEIVRFLRKKFDHVSFVVSGESKSAGTLIVLSGDEILMTDSASLGPIDAQVRIGRSVVSAHNYMQWIDEKREEAARIGALNPFDATMIAQISPGELLGVSHSLDFAERLVKEWLPKYKFRTWTVTETRRLEVTDQMRQERADDIASKLTDHSRWLSHGRSLKIEDLNKIGLEIIRVDENQNLSDIVYRIQTILNLIFSSSTSFKIFATDKNRIFKQAVAARSSMNIPNAKQSDKPMSVATFEIKCAQCSEVHKIYAKLINDEKIDLNLKKKGFVPFPKDAKLKCRCGFEIDLMGVKNELELKIGRKIII